MRGRPIVFLGVGSQRKALDFEEYRFSDIPTEELFWLNKNSNSNQNHAHRKISDFEGMDTKTRLISQFEKSLRVYQKI